MLGPPPATWPGAARAGPGPGHAGAASVGASAPRGVAAAGFIRTQFDPDAAAPPAGMLTAQLEGGLQQRRGRRWARPTGVIAGLQRRRGRDRPGLCRARRIRSRTVLRGKPSCRAMSEAVAPSRAMRSRANRRESSVARGIGVDSQIREATDLAGLYQVDPVARNFVSQFRAKLRVA